MKTCDFQMIFHEHYSPDLEPSGFHLIPNLKRKIEEVFFFSNDYEVVVFWNSGFPHKTKDKNGLLLLQECSMMTLQINADYVEI